MKKLMTFINSYQPVLLDVGFGTFILQEIKQVIIVEPPVETNSPQQPVFQNTKSFQVNHFIRNLL